ncbi:MAG: Methionine-tRNA ligase [Candidatus Taylorbacteria bacterium]|nr:Methionine-tRNA ligase [Candidatus Taylorbacteria bacterium]
MSDEIKVEESVVAEVKVNPKISIDDLSKIEVTLGKILSAEKIEGSEKLLKLRVDFKEESGPRQILSGIRKYFEDEQVLVGQKCMFVTNLAPRMMMGLESNGMLFALGGGDTPFSLLRADDAVEEGTKAN